MDERVITGGGEERNSILAFDRSSSNFSKSIQSHFHSSIKPKNPIKYQRKYSHIKSPKEKNQKNQKAQIRQNKSLPRSPSVDPPCDWSKRSDKKWVKCIRALALQRRLKRRANPPLILYQIKTDPLFLSDPFFLSLFLTLSFEFLQTFAFFK